MMSKPDWEERIFRHFCAAASFNLDPASVRHGCDDGHEPDLFCRIDGASHAFELVEAVDESLARSVMLSLRKTAARQTAAIAGGAFSQVVPLEKVVSHLAKPYWAAGDALSLLVYYDKQYQPPSELDVFESAIGRAVRAGCDPSAVG